MPRKLRRSKRNNVHGVEEWQRVLLAFGPAGVLEMHPAKKFDLMTTRPEKWREWWLSQREEIRAAWHGMFPETMPWAWWEFEAPRWNDRRFSAWSSRLPAPRLKISGSGVYRHDKQAYLPVHHSGCYALIEISVDDPPVFESEVEYMRRLDVS
ncbi:MAG TPA: hypothetical protein DDY32_06010 [Desulfobulbaceae bacterium]|nr:hypothetical protein [Desulfobulbaceae bacterium]